jgi:hypothetical protein
MSEGNVVGFNKEVYLDLVKQYKKASKENLEQFNFNGVELVTKYAYYLLFFVSSKLFEQGQISKKQTFEMICKRDKL